MFQIIWDNLITFPQAVVGHFHPIFKVYFMLSLSIGNMNMPGTIAFLMPLLIRTSFIKTPDCGKSLYDKNFQGI